MIASHRSVLASAVAGWAIVSGLLLSAGSFAQPTQQPKVAGVPDVCLRNGGRSIDECPSTCQTACSNPAINRGREVAEACDRLYRAVAAKAPEPAFCRTGPLPDLKFADHETTKKKCTAEYPGAGDSDIPVPPEAEPPACFVSAMNLKCRFDALAERGRAFNTRLQQVTLRSYKSLHGEPMCKLKRADVEGDYKLSAAVQGPLNQLKSDFNEEIDCLTNYEKSLNKRPCGNEGEACDERKKKTLEVLEGRLAPSRTVASDARAALIAAENAVKDISSFWASYKDLCF